MVPKRWVAVAILLALGGGLAACSRVQEPWTPRNGPLAKDRLRPPALQAELRDRVVHTQIDR